MHAHTHTLSFSHKQPPLAPPGTTTSSQLGGTVGPPQVPRCPAALFSHHSPPRLPHSPHQWPKEGLLPLVPPLDLSAHHIKMLGNGVRPLWPSPLPSQTLFCQNSSSSSSSSSSKVRGFTRAGAVRGVLLHSCLAT